MATRRAICSLTAASINTVPLHYAGMASATANLLRDFGFTLGPAVVGAVALSRAAGSFGSGLAGADLPAAQQRAAQAVGAAGGPLAVNGLPPGTPGSAAHSLAMSALGHGYAVGYALCGCASLLAALLTVLVMRGGTHAGTVDSEALVDEETAQARSGLRPVSG